MLYAAFPQWKNPMTPSQLAPAHTGRDITAQPRTRASLARPDALSTAPQPQQHTDAGCTGACVLQDGPFCL
jgi:hypothetical protein